jgi:hypothetical protein
MVRRKSVADARACVRSKAREEELGIQSLGLSRRTKATRIRCRTAG